MKILQELHLKENDKKALNELKAKIYERFPDSEIILYGSKARGDSDEESDIDLLILINYPPQDWEAGDIDSNLERQIRDISFDLELKYEVVFNILIESKQYWDTPLANAMPIHWNIENEGVYI